MLLLEALHEATGHDQLGSSAWIQAINQSVRGRIELRTGRGLALGAAFGEARLVSPEVEFEDASLDAQCLAHSIRRTIATGRLRRAAVARFELRTALLGNAFLARVV